MFLSFTSIIITMKSIIPSSRFLFLFLFLFFADRSIVVAQGFSYALEGDPVDITGWEMGEDSYVDEDEIILTDPETNQAGYIYYATPSSLTACSQFTVTFDFLIDNSSFPTADGIAFWYISNPPSGFTAGGGIGLPSDPDGLVLIFDTYNNDGVGDNPLISLRHLDGTSDYAEGTSTGQLDDDLVNQDWLVDEEWHTCVLTYYYGDITVSFDGGSPVMTGTTSLDGFDGYFGFSAGTGALYAKHHLRNVLIEGAPIPLAPSVEDVTYCKDAPASQLTATGDNLRWYTSAVGGMPLAEAPTPNTSVPGTYTWYVSQQIDGCDIESERAAITVTVSPPPPPPAVDYIPDYCQGETFVPFETVGSGVLWYTTETGGIGSAEPPVVNTDAVGDYTWYASQTVEGCESVLRTPVTVTVHTTPVADFNFLIHYGCVADTLVFEDSSEDGLVFRWNFGDDSPFTYGASAMHIYPEQDEYAVRLTVTNGACSDSVLKFINTRHPLAATFDVSADTICQGTQVSFINTSVTSVIDGTDPSFLWDFADGNTAVTQSPDHVFDVAGIFNVMMVVTDFVPCSDTAYKWIYVDSSAHINFSMSDTMLCVGDGISLEAFYTQNGIQEIFWTFGDNGDVIYNSNPTMRSYDREGVFDITVQAEYRVCPEATATRKIYVKPLPVVNLGPDTALCLNDAPVFLSSAATLSPGSIYWNWSTGDTTPVLKIVHPGVYRVTADLNGCKGSDEIEITKDCYTDIPNSFTPNNDGTNDYFFPRQLLSEGVARFNMQVFNRWGQIVFETSSVNGRGWDGRFNEKDQPEGVYIYKIDVVMKNLAAEHYTGNVTLLR